MKLKLIVLLMALGMILPGLLPAAEIITEEDISQKVVIEENFILEYSEKSSGLFGKNI